MARFLVAVVRICPRFIVTADLANFPWHVRAPQVRQSKEIVSCLRTNNTGSPQQYKNAGSTCILKNNVSQYCTYHVSTQVNTENGDSTKRKRNGQDDKHEERADLWDITSQCVCNRLFQVIKDQTT